MVRICSVSVFVYAYVFCLCNANTRASRLLRFSTSILYDARVTVCLRVHERVCVASVPSFCVYTEFSCARLFCLWYAYVRVMCCICVDACVYTCVSCA